MFKTSTPVIEAPVVMDDPVGPAADLIPCSVIALDLDTPTIGWVAYCSGRDIPIVRDDLGRDCINRVDARQLFAEHREAEARRLAVMARNEQRAIEADRLRRAQIWTGLSADSLPVGVSAATAMLAAGKDALPRRQTPLEHALANSGEMTYHELPREDES
jgi:hypothetical protein